MFTPSNLDPHCMPTEILTPMFAGEPPEMDDEEEYEDEEEDLTKDPEEDTYKFLKLLIQSLQQLDRLDETEEVQL